MFPKDIIQKKLDEAQARAVSRGFTLDYQKEREQQGNTICRKELAPATLHDYENASLNWTLWRLSRDEPAHDPNPTPEILKSFAEYYIASRKDLPTQGSACNVFTKFTAKWERDSGRFIPLAIKKDVLNYIRQDLTKKYGLRARPRERFIVTVKDIEYLLRGLFEDDWHDYKHERVRVQTASALAFFAGTGTRVGAAVESSSYRHSNEGLSYKHISFNIKWNSSEPGKLKRWVTVDPEFLKGWRYRDDKWLARNWFNENPILALNFAFWVIVHGVADGAFRGLNTVADVLAIRPPNGRESLTLEWNPEKKDLLFFRMVTPEGPDPQKALTFSSLRHNFHSLAQRECFKDKLRVHGIRANVANCIDPKATTATRTQALDHENPTTFFKYQSVLKSLDFQAMIFDLIPDYECRDMEQSMAHHRDINVPQKLDAAATDAFHATEEVQIMNRRIAHLTSLIAGKPQVHDELTAERTRLYTKKTHLLGACKRNFIRKWWESAYDEYVTGNTFNERDRTSLFSIFEKFIPERARLRNSLYTEAKLDSSIGQQCLEDMVSLCQSTERVAYYPGLSPVNDCCPRCLKPVSTMPMQTRSKHILQCQRRSLGGAHYQQLYRNGSRAHRRAPKRQFVQFCYLCAELCCDEKLWLDHCRDHLVSLQPRCGLLTFRYTLVAPGFCPFCLGDEDKQPDERFQQWLSKTTLLNHIDDHVNELKDSSIFLCPHPCCQRNDYKDPASLSRHFLDAHSIEEPRSNSVNRKRKRESNLSNENEAKFISHGTFEGPLVHNIMGAAAEKPNTNETSIESTSDIAYIDMEEMDIEDIDVDKLMEEFTNWGRWMQGENGNNIEER